MRKHLGKAAVIGAVLIVAAAGLGAPKEKYENLQIFAKVLNLVQEYYVEEVDTKKLIYGGIKGMLNELDPHTNFLPPEIFQEFENETTGEFGGLGIELTVEGGILTILAPIEDTPAWKAGIKSGDKIVTIEGETTKGLSLVEAAKRLKGKRGQKIRLGIYRDGFEKPREFVIERDVIKVRSVKYTDLEEGYGYLKVTSFIERTSKEMEDVLEKMKKGKGIKGIVIDLRNNPGGLLEQAIRVSDFFLDEGVIVSTVGRSKREKPDIVEAKKEGGFGTQFPIIVLINEYSASASEIVSGALQDNNRALIMGQRSFGKGSVQSVVKLGDGSGLKLTVARYFTPNGISIQAEGIKPDIPLEDIDAEAFKKAIVQQKVRREADIEGHLKGDKERKKEEREKGTGGPDLLWFLKASGSTEDKKNLSPKEELFSKDFQVLQAFNYLKSWDFFMREKAKAGEAAKKKE